MTDQKISIADAVMQLHTIGCQTDVRARKLRVRTHSGRVHRLSLYEGGPGSEPRVSGQAVQTIVTRFLREHRLARVVTLLEQHERCPRYEGRRALDKSCGEVYEVTDPDCIPAAGYPVVATTPERDFEGEHTAQELAARMSREWTAEQIIKVLS